MREALTGADFVAVRRISTKQNETLAAVGQACTRVPAHALLRLEARGAIRRVKRSDATAAQAETATSKVPEQLPAATAAPTPEQEAPAQKASAGRRGRQERADASKAGGGEEG